MHREDEFYVGEIDLVAINEKYFKGIADLNTLKDDIIKYLNKINDEFQTFEIMIYKIHSTSVAFFVRIMYYEVLPYDELAIKIQDGQIKDIITVDVNERYDDCIIEPILIDYAEPQKCFNMVMELDISERPMSDEELFEFFEDSGIDDELVINDEDEKFDLMDDEMEERFSGIFESIMEDKEDISKVSLPELNKLIGVENFKNELQRISNYAGLSSKLNLGSKERLFPLHYAFTIGSGMGITTILEVFTQSLYKLGLIKKNEFLEYKGNLLFETRSKYNQDTSLFSRSLSGEYYYDDSYSVIAIDILKYIGEPEFDFNKLCDILKYNRGKTVFVFIMGRENKNRVENIINIFNSKINIRYIDFHDYTEDELATIGNRLLKKYGFELDDNAKDYLIKRIKEERLNGTFYNIRTVQKIIEEVRIKKLFAYDNNNTVNELSIKDVKDILDERKMVSANAWKELDELIGLEEVKNRVKEIVSFAKVQKQVKDLGIKSKKNSYHMMFTGNPGTGKTTIARILGKLFKEIGILSIGDTVEVTRDGLVSIYVGNTAPKVREKVREAMGSVLFIDEAYSLYEESPRHNYGKEAVDTLVKLMEDSREDFIVIMAGYKDKMEKLLTVNQGLRERISYKIDFPDYSPEDLTKIFFQLLGNEYILESGVHEKIKELFKLASKTKGESFANGRLARNIAERLIIKQSLRICNENLFDKDSILTIKLQDVEELYKDKDIKDSINNSGEKRMGFIQGE